MKLVSCVVSALCGLAMGGCSQPPKPDPIIPSRVYAEQLRRGLAAQQNSDPRARGSFAPAVRFASDELPDEITNDPIKGAHGKMSPGEVAAAASAAASGASAARPPGLMRANAADGGQDPQFYKFESTMRDKREYNGPLALGDPGMSASLWRESRGNSDLFHDDRAWQPMDLITITVQERSEGNDEANTEIKQKSTVLASIANFLGFETDVTAANSTKDGKSKLDLTSLIKADTQNDFKGQGKTNRKDSLTAKISAMVVEVLPSGILRIEGQKIISVNSEEKVMVLSGLARPKDVNSANEIDSSKIANMRIDYYGKGIVGEAQQGGWMGRAMRTLWPF